MTLPRASRLTRASRSPRVRRVPLASALAAAVLVTGLVGGAGAQTVPAAAQRSTYLVSFRPGTDADSRASELRGQGASVRAVYRHALSGVAADLTDAQAAAWARRPDVTVVEPDGPVTIADTQSPAPWNLDRLDQRNVPLSGNYTYPTSGSGVDIYVVDTGLRTDHLDFTGRVKSGFSVIGDANGTNDCHGHGTHVSGTAAGTIYGVAKGAAVVPVRVLDCGGAGAWSGVISGIDWIVANHEAPAPAVVNLSLGGGASTTVDEAIARLIADGVVVTVAAGNNGLNACNYSPARAPEALTVGATSSTDARASWSNYGSCVDLFAPGVSITSDFSSAANATAVLSGTSMAAPVVAGAAAVRLAANPGMAASSVQTAILVDTTTGLVTSPGTGTPNRLMYNPPGGPAPAATVPQAPGSVTGTATATGTVRVAYSVVGDGGSAITDYDVEYSTVADFPAGTGTFYEGGTSTAASVDVSGLSDGTTYYFRVRATNVLGDSPWSALSPEVTALGLPGSPTTPSAARQASATVRVNFTAPVAGSGAITDYDIEYSTNPNFAAGTGTFFEGGTTATALIDVTGLSNGTMYYFRVRATNAVGDGQWSPLSNGAAPYTTPGAPTNVTATAGSRSATVRWSLPSNGGSPLTKQTILVYRSGVLIGSAAVGPTVTTATVTGLAAGYRHRFAIRATNAAGNGPNSALSNEVLVLS